MPDVAGPVGRTGGDVVVLLDAFGRPAGTCAKDAVHGRQTPFHLAFSVHVVDAAGRVLLTRRARGKATWPGTWSNACCGHPRPDETLREAVTRRLAQELSLAPRRLGLALPDFVYRAEMAGGAVVEHELCPVVVAEVRGEPTPDLQECDACAWVSWAELRERADQRPASLTPWSVAQVARLAALAPSPRRWLDDNVDPTEASVGEVGLDRPLAAGLPAVPTLAAEAVPTGDGVPRRDGRDRWATPAASTALPDPLGAVRPAVDDLLDAYLADRVAEAAALDPLVAPLAEEVRQLVQAGGKRLRPAFVYWGHRATGVAHDDGVLVAAGAVELLHTFALLHDDVMDRSARRRGRPTAHVALAERHRREGLDGDDRWFGTSGALLAGDLAYVWADRLLDSTPVPSDRLDRARAVFTTLRTEVVGGQFLDLRLAHMRDADEQGARRVALLKSARYTVTRPLQLGAALAGEPDPAVTGALGRYGDAVGLAFQMRDDVLGLYGDPAVTGKNPIDDLREGKRTLMVLRALDLTGGEDKGFLTRSLGDPELTEAAAERCCAVIAASGAVASVEALIDAQHALALRALDGLYEPARAALEELAALTVQRGA